MSMPRYKVLKGWHYAFILFRRLGGWYYNKNEYYIKFNLSKECWWSPKRNPDDGDVNKLIGITFGIFGIHKDSIRLGWRPDFENEGMIEILSYVYDKKTKAVIKRPIITIPVETDIYGTFRILKDKYEISVNDKMVVVPNNSPDKKIHKLLYPYVGGNNTAIRTMYFKQKIIWSRYQKRYE